MKKIILLFAAVMTLLSSCRKEEDFTESIFDTNVPVVDQNATTAEFDQWLYDNFVKPYNVEVQYKFNYPASDMNYILAPAEYNRSQLLAHFIRQLFYDVYTKYAGPDFMKSYGPRIFHFIGSSGYSPTNGTEVLGTAAGGVKITLYNINEMKPYSEDVVYNAQDIITINDRVFHTMHHEFSHILHQTKTYPITFGQITSGTYDPITWQERDSTASHTMGYVTQYASSANTEDFVETLSCGITDTDFTWMIRIIDGCLKGVRAGDKEEIMTLIDSLEIVGLDDPAMHWNNFVLYDESEYNDETGEYEPTDRLVIDRNRNLVSQVINKAHTAYVNQYKYTVNRTFKSFRKEFLPWVTVSTDASIMGINAMLKKIDIATTWYTEKWGLYLWTLRREVRERQNTLNDYIHSDAVKIYDYK